jgi:uncharacterized protein (DUF2267 family)
MKTCGIARLDSAAQIAAEWLDQLQDELGWDDRAKVYVLLRETLHALRDFMTVEEASDLAAQLPLLISALYLEGWEPQRPPAHQRSVEVFFQRVQRPFLWDMPRVVPEQAAQAVFTVLGRQILFRGIEPLGVIVPRSLQEVRV